MLKNCILPVNYQKTTSQTCGEIICENLTEFVISCKVCELKLFEFEEFLKHFKQLHLQNKLEQTFNGLDEEEIDNNFKCVVKLEIGEEEIVETNFKEEEDTKNDSEQEFPFEAENSDNDKDYLANSEEEVDEKRSKKPRKIKIYPCEQCDKKYENLRGLNVHIKLSHLRDKSFKCSMCDQTFAQERSLKTHMSRHTGYDCPECQQNCNTKRNLKRHMVQHIGKKFICPESNCGKAFGFETYLKDHQRQCHSNLLLICEECGFESKTRETFNIHRRKHRGEKPYSCTQCDRCFISSSLLAEHKACHETERRHVCDVCGKSFNRHKALFNHKFLHSDVKKYVCKICGSAYAQAPGLSAHMRKHREGGTIKVSNATLTS